MAYKLEEHQLGFSFSSQHRLVLRAHTTGLPLAPAPPAPRKPDMVRCEARIVQVSGLCRMHTVGVPDFTHYPCRRWTTA
jgi:hypothetical protein